MYDACIRRASVYEVMQDVYRQQDKGPSSPGAKLPPELHSLALLKAALGAEAGAAAREQHGASAL